LIYRFLSNLTVSGGSASTISLDVHPGICRQVIVQAGTAATTFMANIVDDRSLRIMDYGINTGEFNDITAFPMYGRVTFSITNASQTDTFKTYFAVEEVR